MTTREDNSLADMGKKTISTNKKHPRILSEPPCHQLIILYIFCVISFFSIVVQLITGSGICANSQKLCSVVVKFITCDSICTSHLQLCSFLDRFIKIFTPLFKKESVLKIAETIGVCSILVAWIYASLDKVELGLRYSDLVEQLLSNYHYYVVAHFVAVLLCLWLSNAEMVESAVLVLCGILYNSWLQWDVLYRVILSSQSRIALAMEVWGNKEKQAKCAKDYKKLALEIVEAIIAKNISETLLLQKELAKILLRYGEQCQRENIETGLEVAIENISWIWEQLLEKRQKSEQIFLSRNVLCCYKEEESDYGAVCAGYVLWLLNDKIIHDEQLNQTNTGIFKEVKNFLMTVAHGEIQSNVPKIFSDWSMIITMLIVLHFENIFVFFDTELISWKSPRNICSDRDKTLLKASAKAYFDFNRNNLNKKLSLFDCIIKQMWPRMGEK